MSKLSGSWALVLPVVLLLLPVASSEAQERTIRGVVQDTATGEPVPNVNVQVKDTNIGTLAGGDGRFVLGGIPDGTVTLVVGRLGWQETEVTVPPGTGRITVHLRRDYLELEQLVVTGRATEVERRNLANAVTTLNTDEINETPQATLTQSLQAKIPGALISQNEGTPGGGLQLRLRGSNTINARSTPLYVVDGILISNFSIGDNRGVLVNGGQGEGEVPRIADINPSEIESIQVLKGPSASAIYGSKAANGVVIIETKGGSAGGPRVNINTRFGAFDLLNVIPTRDFNSVEEAVEVFGPIAAEEPFASNIRQGADFDNQKQIADRNDLSWNGSASVAGGNETTSYFGSVSMKSDEGIIDNTGFERQSARVNVSSIIGEVFNFDLNTNFIHTSQKRGLTNNDNNQTSFWMVFPNTPDFIDLSRRADGTFPRNPVVGNGSNPLQTAALLENKEEVFRFLAGGSGDLQLMENETHAVNLRVNGGVDFFNSENSIFSPPALFFEDFDGRPGTALNTETDNLNLNGNLSGVWEFEPSGDLQLSTSVGAQFERRDPEFIRVVSRDLVGGKPILDAGTIELVQERREQVEDFGFFIQEQILAFDERLSVIGAVRFDQTSANSDDDELFIFPKASVSYRFPDIGGFLDEVKLRGAFGQTGNQPVFGQEFTNLDITGRLEGLAFSSLEGALAGDLEPERQSEVEWGLDLTGFGGRARLEATGYVQFITDLILERDLPPSTGFDTEFFNGGKMRNIGTEIALDATPVEGGFRWDTRTSFFLNRNEVTDLPVAPFFTGNFAVSLGGFQVKEGQSLTAIVGTAGTDAQGNTVIEKLGNSDPRFTFNFSNSFEWNDFRLHTLAEWRQGQKAINLTQLLFDLGANSDDFVDQDGVISPVSECFPGCSGQERIAAFVDGFAQPFVQSASFLKLREVSLSWELPSGIRQMLFGGFLDRASLVATGNNLVRITPYDGLDPEVSQFGNTPFRGVDIAPFPSSRSFFFGVDVSF